MDTDLSEKSTMVGLSISGVGMWLMAGFLGLAAVAQVSSSGLVYHTAMNTMLPSFPTIHHATAGNDGELITLFS